MKPMNSPNRNTDAMPHQKLYSFSSILSLLQTDCGFSCDISNVLPTKEDGFGEFFEHREQFTLHFLPTLDESLPSDGGHSPTEGGVVGVEFVRSLLGLHSSSTLQGSEPSLTSKPNIHSAW